MELYLEDCGGPFRLNNRVDTQTWNKVKQFFTYYDEDWLEDVGLFFLDAGWYTSEDKVTQIEEILNIPPHNRYAIRSKREELERQVAVIVAAKEKTRHQVERAVKGAVYEAWQAQTLGSLVETSAPIAVAPNEWQHLVSFDSDTPGTWYTTGDAWYKAEKDGRPVYRRDYGNACLYFAPQEIVDEACRLRWKKWVENFGEVNAARYFLTDYYRVREPGMDGCYGDDVARRYVELEGLDKLIQLAGREEWLVGPYSEPLSTFETAGLYGLTVTKVAKVETTWSQRAALKPEIRGRTETVEYVCEHPDGRLFGRTYHGNYVELGRTPDQHYVLK
jgi:hypothetical protein